MKSYVTFVRNVSDLHEGRMRLFIRDLSPGKRKYNATHVIAELSRQASPSCDQLFVRTGTGVAYEDQWHVKIIETLDNYVKGAPYGEIIGKA